MSSTHGAITPEQFGARGDGVSDDSAALQAVFDAATSGSTVVLAPGKTYAHSRVLSVKGSGVTLTGGGTLRGTDERNSSLWIDGNNIQVRNVNISNVVPSRRYLAYEQMGIRVRNNRGVVIDGVRVQNSGSAGIFVENAEDFTIKNSSIADSASDGVHVTGGARNGSISGVTVSGSGDDGIGIVSYGYNPAPVTGIRVTDCVVRDQKFGRGFSVVGGKDVKFNRIKTSRTSGAGIYIATEDAPYFTQSVADVTVAGAEIDRANLDSRFIHGAVLISAQRGGTSIQGVALSRLNIAGTDPRADRNIGVLCSGGTVSHVSLDSVSLDHSALKPVVNTCSASALRSELQISSS